MNKQAVNTFIKGMNKDLDKSVMSENSYLNADNFRITTSEGASSGALENIKGNKWLGVSSELESGQLVCGSVRIRDYIILFTTNNTTTTPSGGRSMLYKLILDKDTETATSLTVLYDDSLNASTGTLNFSIANKIKAVAKYESPSIQKIYWTDGYNNLRYADVAKNLTITGSAYTSDDYMAPEMFEFLPLFTSTKPTLSTIVGGHLMSGMVQYAYQLYRLNGAETAFSTVSDMIHIVSDSDFGINTLNYRGDEESVKTGKGCKLTIVNANTGYDRLRLVRLHYSTLNSIPVINVVAEIEIGVNPSTVTITDVGENVSELTLDEFNISSTELFKCEDITIKGSRLFAANIEKDEFTVDEWDSRAVRFRNYIDVTPAPVGSDTTTSHTSMYNNTTIKIIPGGTEKTYQITIEDFRVELASEIPIGRTVTNVTAISTTRTTMGCIGGIWQDSSSNNYGFNGPGSDCTFFPTSYSDGTGELIFTITTSGTDLWGTDWDHIEYGGIFDITYTYSYTTSGTAITYEDAIVYDGYSSLTISKPTDPTLLADWEASRWTDELFPVTHDAINKFNDTNNDGDDTYAFKYQADCTTVGAEGPNIKIDFETEIVELDTSNSSTTFSAGISASESYTNFASPWMDGKLSWQRDETYRLFIVWENDRGQRAAPQWVIDLRMPSLHDTSFQNSSSVSVYPNWIANQSIATGVVYTWLLRPRIYFKSKPANAVSCQIYRVKREREDRSVVTQSLVIPTKVSGGRNFPDAIDQVNLSTDGIELVKLVSPEINISKNIVKQSNDYLEYVAYYTGVGVLSTTSATDGLNRYTHKLVTNSVVPYVDDVKTPINDSLVISPAIDDGVEYSVKIDGKEYTNMRGIAIQGRGCTGLLVSYYNTSWSAEGTAFCVANYKSDVFNSQYGGNTYEDRKLNVSIPCSDVISTTDAWHSIKGGDTFINYFDVSTLLYDLLKTDRTTSESEVVYVPLESSINCDLRHDIESQHLTYNIVRSALRQEYAEDQTFIDTTGGGIIIYNQTKDLYLYNTVYSQQTSAQYAISEMLDTSNETVFDCLVKASNVKYNGENSDSWTKFNVNEEIEVDSNYGEVRAIGTFNEKLLYWQEDAFGILSVNDRSLIQDSASAQLVLGTGGVLSRYDYISDTIGILDNHCLVYSDTSVYWFYDKDTSIYRFNNKLDNLTKSKGMWSWFKENYTNEYGVHGVYDRVYNEVIYTLHKPGTMELEETEYGVIYNWYAVIDARSITSTGWHVPTITEWDTLVTYLGGSSVAGGKLKETGTVHWLTPNTGATNEVGFNAVGSGNRVNGYGSLTSVGHLWMSTDHFGLGAADYLWLDYNSSVAYTGDNKWYYEGLGARIIKDSTTLTHGQTGTYTGNDGQIYNTICIGTQEWLANNLAETKYRDGSDIPIVTDDAAWLALVSGAMCYYNNAAPETILIGSSGYTVAFNEQTDQFTSFYDFTPRIYIDYKEGYLSNKDIFSNTLYLHNSSIEPRCYFYDETFATTIKLLYNNDYPITKVFDNVFYISNAYDEATDVDQYSTTFDQVRCYNDYQNSDWVDLVYPINIMRRERGWTITVPRNLLETDYTDSPDIFAVANIDSNATKVWHERIRDKYMVLDLSFDNTSETRFVVPFIGLKYRLSYR